MATITIQDTDIIFGFYRIGTNFKNIQSGVHLSTEANYLRIKTNFDNGGYSKAQSNARFVIYDSYSYITYGDLPTIFNDPTVVDNKTFNEAVIKVLNKRQENALPNNKITYFFGTYKDFKVEVEAYRQLLSGRFSMMEELVDDMEDFIEDDILKSTTNEYASRLIFIKSEANLIDHEFNGVPITEQTEQIYDLYFSKMKKLFPVEFKLIQQFYDLEDEINPANWYAELIKSKKAHALAHITTGSNPTPIIKYYPKTK